MIHDAYFNVDPLKKDVMAKCRKCGTKAPSMDFRLDDETGIMVCPSCFKTGTHKLAKTPEQKEQKTTAGTQRFEKIPRTIVIRDEEDLFRKFSNEKIQEKREEYQKDTRINYTCDRCGFGFKYNPDKEYPGSCPACGRPVSEIKRNANSMFSFKRRF